MRRGRCPGRLRHAGAVADFPARERFGLGEVRRGERGEREQAVAQRGDRVVRQELRAARGDHDGIDDFGKGRLAGETRGDRLDDGRRGEHAGLERADRVGGQDRVELRDDEGRGRHFDGVDAGGILRGERGDRGAGVEAERVEGADVGLQTGVAAAVAAGDRKGGQLPPVAENGFHGAKGSVGWTGAWGGGVPGKTEKGRSAAGSRMSSSNTSSVLRTPR